MPEQAQVVAVVESFLPLQHRLDVAAEDADAAFVADLPVTRTLIVYGNGDIGDLPASVTSFEGDVLILEGGYDAFAAAILTAPELGEDATPAEIDDYRLRSALHAHFTGSAIQSAPPPKPGKKIKRAGSKKEGGC